MRGFWILVVLLSLTGCNWLGSVTGLTKDANKAIGAACRQTGRSLEECYLRNPDADKAAIYGGWREMSEYMVKNKLPDMPPPKEPTAASAAAVSRVAPEAAVASASHGMSPNVNQPLSNEEAEKAAKTDPEVQAVLAAIRQRDPSTEKAPVNSAGEPEQKRLLNVINELNKPGSSAPKQNATN
ncbi:hypothetical protein HZU77_006560 [Neisseriaceae bacterium TC5R-5]|nr:hypothetical protein [Neisseriaceae bacterium TC5R-5]